jgi:hypothetical protein
MYATTYLVFKIYVRLLTRLMGVKFKIDLFRYPLFKPNGLRTTGPWMLVLAIRRSSKHCDL